MFAAALLIGTMGVTSAPTVAAEGRCHPQERESSLDANAANDEVVSVTGERNECQGEREAPPTTTEVEFGVWVDGDCASVPLTHVSAASWCASRESWAEGAPEYVCNDGSPARTPDKIRTRPLDPPGQPWGPWRLNTVPCPGDGPAQDDELKDAVEREMARLKVDAAPALIAPVTEWFAVQTPLTVYTRAATQRFEVSLVGSRVQIEVVPEVFSWDFGDGSAPLVTTERGAPYPDQTLTHTFTKKGSRTVELTTEWRGRFRVVGEDSWREVDGRARTRHAAAPVEVREIRSVLS
ncbi:hypothetical protein [Sanguibacter sp. HDW7]|uniref:hypothetical protein n=1 Tax=Sanguibacter sp. HDW7 TaxID=2714931 RepID=UPI0014086316|nr:hypothetical protein [Sanguibacter sp. HDW7]QIK83673.1 hypothetical protein G7063_08580 [Sanguibacter sp. HDW7]